MNRNFHVVVLIVLILAVVAGSYLVLIRPNGSGNHSENNFFSFEEEMEGWVKNGTDLDNPPVEWSVGRSENLATHGDYSLRYYLSNVNDAGKIWIERPFQVEPNTSYKVNVSYDFASADYGDINLWKIITGVHKTTPRDSGELIFQGDTGNGASSDVGYKWMDKSYEFTINSDSNGEIYLVIGVWGTWETGRFYYLDNLNVNIEEIGQSGVVTEDKSKLIAKNFVKNSPTYKFDGSDLEYIETLYPDTVDCPYCWTFVFEFTSGAAGYGDRSDESVNPVITPHEAHVTVENGEVTNAILDLKWDMINQKFLDNEVSYGVYVFDHSGVGGSIIENGLEYDPENVGRQNFIDIVNSKEESKKFDYSLIDNRVVSFIDSTNFDKSCLLVFQEFPASTEPDYEIKSIQKYSGNLKVYVGHSSQTGTDDITIETMLIRLPNWISSEFETIAIISEDNNVTSLVV